MNSSKLDSKLSSELNSNFKVEDKKVAKIFKKYGIIMIGSFLALGFFLGLLSLVVPDYTIENAKKNGIFYGTQGGKACIGSCPSSDDCVGTSKCQVDKAFSIISLMLSGFVILTILFYVFFISFDNKSYINHRFNCGVSGLTLKIFILMGIIGAFVFQTIAYFNQILTPSNGDTLVSLVDSTDAIYGSGMYLSMFSMLFYLWAIIMLVVVYCYYVMYPDMWTNVCV